MQEKSSTLSMDLICAGWRWHYKVSYKKRDTVIVLYDEQEICIDPAWIRDKKIKELGI